MRILFLLLFPVFAYSLSLTCFTSGNGSYCMNNASHGGSISCSVSLSGDVVTLSGCGKSVSAQIDPSSFSSPSWVSYVFSSTTCPIKSGSLSASCSASSCSAFATGDWSNYSNNWFVNSGCSVSFPGSSLPSCSNLLSIPAPACKGGMGLWAVGDLASIPVSNPPPYGEYYILLSGLPLGSIQDRPDGSQCVYNGNDEFPLMGYVCPLGPVCDGSNESLDNPICQSSSSSSEEESSSSSDDSDQSSSSTSESNSSSSYSPYCELYPNDPFCAFCIQNPYHSSCQDSPSSDSGGSSSSGRVCDNYPWLSICQNSSDSSGSGEGEGGGSSDSGNTGPGGNGNCTDFSNCDWAKLEYQLVQLNIDIETRNYVRDVINELRNGRSENTYAFGVLENAINNLNSSIHDGTMSIIDAIDRLADVLGSSGDSNSSGGNGSSSSGNDGDDDCTGVYGLLQSIFTSNCDGSPSGTCTGEDCYGGNSLDTSGMGGRANSLIQGGGRNFVPYTDQQISQLIPIPTSGQCPIVNDNISFGGKSIPVSIDFNHLVPGSSFNVALFIKTVLLITVYFINVFTMIAIFRSGGKK
jgi:hypothetical protein